LKKGGGLVLRRVHTGKGGKKGVWRGKGDRAKQNKLEGGKKKRKKKETRKNHGSQSRHKWTNQKNPFANKKSQTLQKDKIKNHPSHGGILTEREEDLRVRRRGRRRRKACWDLGPQKQILELKEEESEGS